MIEFLSNYGLFALKMITVVVTVGAVLFFLVSGVMHQSHTPSEGHLEVTKLNDRLDGDRRTLLEALSDSETSRMEAKRKRAQDKAERKAKKKQLKQAAKQPLEGERPREKACVYVIEFRGDLQASTVSSLRREISAILSVAQSDDEVVVRLESGGGLVHSYGLAASQLQRIRDASIPLTVCVDKIAASGGYMMACVAPRVLAAPFAIIGSIGVVAQLPNFHRLLDKHDIDFELLTAGKHKRTLTMFGKNTDEGRQKFVEELEDTHELFKQFVGQHRPLVDLESTATGEVWFGQRALAQGLIDGIQTSDEYLTQACARADVFEVKFQPKKSLQDRLAHQVENSAVRLATRLWERGTRSFPA